MATNYVTYTMCVQALPWNFPQVAIIVHPIGSSKPNFQQFFHAFEILAIQFGITHDDFLHY